MGELEDELARLRVGSTQSQGGKSGRQKSRGGATEVGLRGWVQGNGDGGKVGIIEMLWGELGIKGWGWSV